MPDIPNWLRDKVAKGELGRKAGKGLYDWKDGKAVNVRVDDGPNYFNAGNNTVLGASTALTSRKSSRPNVAFEPKPPPTRM